MSLETFKAIPEIDLEGPCTGSVISDSGLLLTAAHCAPRCLESATTQIDGIPVIDPIKARALTCQIGTSQYRVRATSTCDSNADATAKARNLPHCTGAGDFLVLEPLRKNTSPCLPVSRTVPETETRLMAAGYVGKTERRTGNSEPQMNADGKGISLSFGKRTNQESCQVVASRDTKEIGKEYRLFPMRSEYMQTDLDASGGMSGGPVLNQNLEIVGLVSIGPAGAKFRQCQGGTFISPIKEILSTIRAQGLDADEMFRCESKKLKMFTETISL